jgi:EmrB/QacA subfamily drug resistance transporter
MSSIKIPPYTKIITPLIVACALFMEHLDSSIIATALPTISQSLHTDPLHLSLAITSYMFSLAVFIPLSGWAADRLGARTVFMWAIVVFTMGSIACGLSINLPMLVISRVFQGLGGAMMVPVGRLVVLRTVPKAGLVDAMAWVTAPALIGPVLGPPIGGLIVTYASWRWIFLVNVPIGILGIYLANKYIENIIGRSREPLDKLGFVLVGLSMGALMFSFETLGRHFVPNSVIAACFVGSIFCFSLYLLHMRRIQHPIIDLSVMKFPTYFYSVVGGTLFRVGIGALPFLLPLMLQIGFGQSAATSGFLTFAGAVGAILMKLIASTVIRALGFRVTLLLNSFINALFMGGCAFFVPQTPHSIIFIFLLVGGVFRSLQFTALNTIAYAEIPDHMMSRANTLYNMFQQMSLSFGVAMGALMLNTTIGWYHLTKIEAGIFWPSYTVIGIICLLSMLLFMPLSPQAGEEVSGHKIQNEDSVRKELA